MSLSFLVIDVCLHVTQWMRVSASRRLAPLRLTYAGVPAPRDWGMDVVRALGWRGPGGAALVCARHFGLVAAAVSAPSVIGEDMALPSPGLLATAGAPLAALRPVAPVAAGSGGGPTIAGVRRPSSRSRRARRALTADAGVGSMELRSGPALGRFPAFAWKT